MLAETIGQRKKRLRRQIQERRKLLSESVRNQRDDQIADRLLYFYDQNHFERIFSFMSTRNEPNLTDRLLLNRPNIEVFAPIIKSDFRMSFHQVQPGVARLLNSFGIEEPPPSAPSAENTSKTLILVPCLAVSRTGNRLGYGGGYYDRYFAAKPEGFKLGILYSEFIIAVESEPHDFKLDGFCSESELVLLTSSK